MNFAQTGPVNRVSEAIALYAYQEAQAIALNPGGWAMDKAGLELKQRFYEGIAAASYPIISNTERQALRYVRHQIRRMRAAQHPNWWNRVVYHPASIFLRNFLLQRREAFRQLENRQRSTVNHELRTLNVHASVKSLTDAGFKIPMESVLVKMMNQEMPHFHFRYSDPTRCSNTEFVLHFERLPNSNYYQFSSFTASALGTGNTSQEQFQQVFRQNLDAEACQSLVTAEEAAVLVNGGHVSRIDTGNEYWIALDRTGVNPPGRTALTSTVFDLDKSLNRVPLTSLTPAQMERLKAGLRSGHPRIVELLINKEKVKARIQANPAHGGLTITDLAGRKIDLSSTTKRRANSAAANTLKVVEDVQQSVNNGKSKGQRNG
ncbi:hypothetical protein [Chitinophaga alhagiae]|uniref:hypothetical protein n=1 Tax=Chitinophaga alhagiae TaxID=2203219 RepID=UPI000E5C5794|nr:hypothetical protein [Chitinophaga alhagiae]